MKLGKNTQQIINPSASHNETRASYHEPLLCFGSVAFCLIMSFLLPFSLPASFPFSPSFAFPVSTVGIGGTLSLMALFGSSKSKGSSSSALVSVGLETAIALSLLHTLNPTTHTAFQGFFSNSALGSVVSPFSGTSPSLYSSGTDSRSNTESMLLNEEMDTASSCIGGGAELTAVPDLTQ